MLSFSLISNDKYTDSLKALEDLQNRELASELRVKALFKIDENKYLDEDFLQVFSEILTTKASKDLQSSVIWVLGNFLISDNKIIISDDLINIFKNNLQDLDYSVQLASARILLLLNKHTVLAVEVLFDFLINDIEPYRDFAAKTLIMEINEHNVYDLFTILTKYLKRSNKAASAVAEIILLKFKR